MRNPGYWSQSGRTERLRLLYPNPAVTWNMLRAEFPGKTQSEIAQAARRLGLPKPYRVGNRDNTPWAPEHKQFLLDNAGVLPISEIAAAIGKTPVKVTSMMRHMGLTDFSVPEPGPPSKAAAEGMARLHEFLF